MSTAVVTLTRDKERELVGHMLETNGSYELPCYGVVKAVDVDRASRSGGASEQFAQDWARYSIDQVLTRYGEPSQVRLSCVPIVELGAPPYHISTAAPAPRLQPCASGFILRTDCLKRRVCHPYCTVSTCWPGQSGPAFL